jgi:uncharacterized membrane protein YgdD (TMEM256/DUF423 family)
MMKLTIATGILFAFVSILFGALGSHALKPTLVERQAVESFQIARDFTMYHGLALILLGILMHLFPTIKFNYVAIAFVAGSLLFQGVIFTKSFVDVGKFGILNPIGGSILFLGWIYFFYLVVRHIK